MNVKFNQTLSLNKDNILHDLIHIVFFFIFFEPMLLFISHTYLINT